MTSQWKPNVTVAAIIEQDGKFLMVEEQCADGLRFNQPAGHLENQESLLQAVIREVQEETAYLFQPTALLGTYLWKHPDKDLTYLRFAFIGDVSDHNPGQPLDDGITRATWMTMDEIRTSQHRHRSPQVLMCLEHYLAGQRFPLAVISHLS
jgi:8-oxo-dGTP pyrophosphatase MutT (NUDIX family)